MDQLINLRRESFRKYCIKNINWLNTQKINFPSKMAKKETVLIEFREIPHLYFTIKNTLRVLNSEWKHTIVCGRENYEFIKNIVNKINRDIRIIVTEYNNVTRLEYSLLLLDSNFYKQFSGDYLLIYQEDTIIFRDIPKKYFQYDFVGAPLPNFRDKFNGGFSLRNKNKMIEICQLYYDKEKSKLLDIKNFVEENEKKIRKFGYNIIDKEFKFLYKIEESILEDLLICEKCSRLPNFEDANEFSVEKYYYQNPIGGHQFWYSLKKMELWLDLNLKSLNYY